MLNKRNCIVAFLALPFIGFSQQPTDSITIQKKLDEVNVSALRANEKTPVTFTNLNKSEIEKGNLGEDFPYIISLTPSVVTTSDAGAGVGYTGFRIRGSDPTRINVTVNGIPLNDSESQGVWWVNMPDFTSSVDNIQIQRGVGTSTNGASAFGASVNLKTIGLNKNAYATTNNSYGSYTTIKNNFEFGTGLLNDRFAFDGRLSRISSDGYIDRATSNLKSFYFQGAYFRESSILKAITFSGQERTYQAWYGVPFSYSTNDILRTYNPYNYENEIDNYGQTHYQLHYSKCINANTNYNVAWHYTQGEGYYEQFKEEEDFLDYGLNNIIIGNETILSTDLIRRKWLNNNFGGFIYSLKHKMKAFDLTLGGASNRYSGQHYGNIIWAEYASNSTFNHQYYWNKAEKIDHNFYVKMNYNLSPETNLYTDLQRRIIVYQFLGKDEYGNGAMQEISLAFFNPKFGLHQKLNNNQIIYASFAVANKEPNRDDYVKSTVKSRPEHEILFDTEIGYKYVSKKLLFSANTYYMNYKNQLVLTGQINDVGAYTRTNVKKSFRKGVELEGMIILDMIKWSGNLTISQNKIEEFTEFIDNWDNLKQEKVKHKNTDLSFSPSVIWVSQFDLKFTDKMTIDFISKYVGKQFIDNTSSENRILDDYLTNNLRITYNIKNSSFKIVKLTLQVNNLLNNQYVSNAWVYRFISDNWDPRESDSYVSSDSERGYNKAAYFPQAGRNYFLGLTIGF